MDPDEVMLVEALWLSLQVHKNDVAELTCRNK